MISCVFQTFQSVESSLSKMLRRHLWSFVLVATLFSLNQCYVTAGEINFELGEKEGSTTAIVKDQRFSLDVKLGDKYDYPTPKKFNLKISDCSVEITVESISTGILCTLKVPGDMKTVIDLNSIVAIPKAIVFKGTDTSKIECDVIFGDKKDGKYYIPVALSGDVPTSFKLSSTSAKMDEPSKPEVEKTNWVMILGIAGGSGLAFLLVVGSLIASFCIYRRRKNKEKLYTVKSTETAISKTSETTGTELTNKRATLKLDDSKAKDKQEAESKKDSSSERWSNKKSDKKKRKSNGKKELSSERKSKKKAKKRKAGGKKAKEEPGSEVQSDIKKSDRDKSDYSKKPEPSKPEQPKEEARPFIPRSWFYAP